MSTLVCSLTLLPLRGICNCCREVVWIGCPWSTELCHCSYMLSLPDPAEKGLFHWLLYLQYLAMKGMFSLTLITNSCSVACGRWTSSYLPPLFLYGLYQLFSSIPSCKPAQFLVILFLCFADLPLSGSSFALCLHV